MAKKSVSLSSIRCTYQLLEAAPDRGLINCFFPVHSHWMSSLVAAYTTTIGEASNCFSRVEIIWPNGQGKMDLGRAFIDLQRGISRQKSGLFHARLKLALTFSHQPFDYLDV